MDIEEIVKALISEEVNFKRYKEPKTEIIEAFGDDDETVRAIIICAGDDLWDVVIIYPNYYGKTTKVLENCDWHDEYEVACSVRSHVKPLFGISTGVSTEEE